uniref:Uncharacterized protein n=1 Tax=Arundo donax TaxID=35708 RepID=A0A0A9CSY4_ARUDO
MAWSINLELQQLYCRGPNHPQKVAIEVRNTGVPQIEMLKSVSIGPYRALSHQKLVNEVRDSLTFK